MTDRELMQQALDYIIETNRSSSFQLVPASRLNQVITALRDRLAQPEQEPVAWMCSDESLAHKGYSRFSRTCEGAWNIPVYTAPNKNA